MNEANIPKTDSDLRKYINEYSNDHSIWLDESERETVCKILALYINCTNKESYNTNVLIHADNPKAAVYSGEAIVAILKKWFSPNNNDFAVSIDEKKFLSHAYDRQYKHTILFLVHNFNATDTSSLLHVFEEIQNHRWDKSVILCTSNDALAKLKEDSTMDYRLFHYLCGTKLHIVSNETDIISQSVINHFNHDAIPMSDSFKIKLKKYISVVYPEAQLQDSEFVEDLIYRIRREHFSHLEITEEFTDQDIPYSLKAELLDTNTPVTEPKPSFSTPNTESQAAEKDEINEAEIHEQCPVEATVPHYNVLVLAMSTFPGGNKIRLTKFKDGITNNNTIKIIGRSQLDPVPKYIAGLLEQNGECLDKIIILATEQTLEEEEITTPEGKQFKGSAVDYFKKQVSGYMNPAGKEDGPESFDKNRFKIIPVSENEPATGMNGVLKELRSLRNEHSTNFRLYMDVHGGLRGVQRILEAMIILLKNENIDYEDVYSIEIGKDKIITEKERMKIYHLVSGLNEFYQDGKINTLLPFLEDNPQSLMVTAIKMISEGLEWCNVNKFESGLAMLREYSNNRFNTVNQNQNSYLKLFEETIFQDFAGLITAENISILDEIQWCTKKKFYQQALTFIESRMSQQLLDWGVYSVRINSNNTDEWTLIPDSGHNGSYRFRKNTGATSYNTTNINALFNSIVYDIVDKPIAINHFNNMSENDFDDFQNFANRSEQWHAKDFMNDYRAMENHKFSLDDDVKIRRNRRPEVIVARHTKFLRPLKWRQLENVQGPMTPELQNLLLLHKTMKVIRNNMNHADSNAGYDSVKISLALRYYISWAEKIKEQYYTLSDTSSVLSTE